MTNDTNLATDALAGASPVELAPGARGPAIAGAVTGLFAIGFGFLAGRLLGSFAGLALVLEALPLFIVAAITTAGYVGLDKPWWSTPLGKRWPHLATKRTKPWPGFLYFTGAVLAAPTATHLGLLAWAVANPAASGLRDQWLLAWAFGLFGWIGLLTVMVIAWRVCFAPLSSDRLRWVPLAILAAGALADMVTRFSFDVFPSAHWWVSLLAIAWGVALGKATPARLGYAVHGRAAALTWSFTDLEEAQWKTPHLRRPWVPSRR